MTFLQMQILVSIIENESFTKAGDKLGLSQSAISHALKNLEEEWGVKLLERNRNGIELMPIGARLLPYAKEMIRLGEVMEQEVAKEKGLQIGTVRIGSFPTASTAWLPEVFLRFQQRYPSIEVSLLEGGYNEIHYWLQHAKIDLAILPVPQAEFEMIELLNDPFIAVVPENHPLAGQETCTIQDLNGQNFIMSLAGLEQMMRQWIKKVGIKPRVLFSLQNTTSILAMVRKGIGVSIVPSSSMLPPSGIKVLPVDIGLQRTIGLTARSFQQLSPAVQEMVSVFKEVYLDETAAT